jgi:glycosyltransferase involved in cell wall biosynthesis
MTTSTHDPQTGSRRESEPSGEPSSSAAAANATALVPIQERPKQIIGRFTAQGNGHYAPVEAVREVLGEEAFGLSSPLALFCHEPPDSYIGGHVRGIISALARRGSLVHLFCRHAFEIAEPGVKVHVVGAGESQTGDTDVVSQAHEFTRRAANAFMQEFSSNQPVRVIGYEWSSAPVLSLLRGLRNLLGVLSLHSLERQRTDLSSEIAQKIAEIEREGIENARSLLLHDPGTAEVLRHWIPESVDRVVHCRSLFEIANFENEIDPGTVKARYQVGPIDPMILFVGDLDERYGPDLLIKAMPAILPHHPQARLVIVGDGPMFWPLRVYARYLLLENAIRLVGHVTDQPMYELIQAADIVAVPSREATPWWPILAGWAARRPVLATHDAAKKLLAHEQDSVLVYPSENSIVWGVERLLYDPELRKSVGNAGRKKLESRFGWNAIAQQVEELFAPAAVAKRS